MGTWSVISSSSASGTGVVAVNRPSPAPAANDLILIFFGANATASPSAPTGFADGNLTPTTGGAGGQTAWSDFFVRVADGAEGATFTVTGTATGWNELGCVVMRDPSMDATTPVDTSAGQIDAIATTTPVAPAITTGRNGDAVLTFFCNSAAGISTLTPPGGELQILFWDGDAVINWETQAIAGDTGTKTETMNTGAAPSVRYHNWTVALQEALPPATGSPVGKSGGG